MENCGVGLRETILGLMREASGIEEGIKMLELGGFERGPLFESLDNDM